VAKIRKKYGFATMQRGVLFADEKLGGLDIRKESQPRSDGSGLDDSKE
jgi:hypothetical protein